MLYKNSSKYYISHFEWLFTLMNYIFKRLCGKAVPPCVLFYAVYFSIYYFILEYVLFAKIHCFASSHIIDAKYL